MELSNYNFGITGQPTDECVKGHEKGTTDGHEKGTTVKIANSSFYPV